MAVSAAILAAAAGGRAGALEIPFGPDLPRGGVAADDREEQADPVGDGPLARRLGYADWLRVDNPQKALETYETVRDEADGENEEAVRCAAELGRARCLLDLGRPAEAFEAVEASFPEMPPAPEALAARCRLEVTIGRRLLGAAANPASGAAADGGEPAEKSGEAAETASRVFAAALYNDPEGPAAPQALLGLARAEEARGRTERAAAAYRRFVRTWPDAPDANAARIGRARCLLSPDPDDELRAEALEEAEAVLAALDRLPATEQPSELEATRRLLRERRAGKKLKAAEFYLRTPNGRARNAARFLLERVTEDYADTEAAERARRRLAALAPAAGTETQ